MKTSWHAPKDSNLDHPVLETGVLPVKPETHKMRIAPHLRIFFRLSPIQFVVDTQPTQSSAIGTAYWNGVGFVAHAPMEKRE